MKILIEVIVVADPEIRYAAVQCDDDSQLSRSLCGMNYHLTLKIFEKILKKKLNY